MRSEPIQNRRLGRLPLRAANQTALMLTLSRLVDDLLVELTTTPQSSSPAAMELRWEDEQNIYLEIPVKFKSDQEIDICIVEGKAFIRLDR